MEKLQLIVPIAVKALVVPEEDKISKLSLTSRLEGMAFFGEEVQFNLKNVLDGRDKTYCKKGIHLHWSLPKLLKHGVSTETGEIEFPPVPNRWLIVRYKQDSTGKTPLQLKSWVIKSDGISDSKESSNNWVEIDERYASTKNTADGDLEKVEQLVYKTIGSVVEGSTLVEKQEESVDLTAVGAANPFFSEIYDECENVFGFCDEAKDLKYGESVSYIVTGWYSDLTDDPLNMNTTVSPRLVERIKKNWKYLSDKQPESTLYHSTLYSVEWTADKTYGFDNAAIGVAVGNSTVEAFSAYLANQLGETSGVDERKKIELSLNALQHQLLEDEAQLPVLDYVEVEQRKRNFQAKQRGYIWEIKKIETGIEAEQTEVVPHFPQEKEIVQQLRKLNTIQIEQNELKEQLLSLKREAYFSWYKKAKTEKNADSVPNFRDTNYFNSLKTQLYQELSELKVTIEQNKNRQKEIQQKIHLTLQELDRFPTIRTVLNTTKLAEYELVQTVEDRFWEPNEPAVIFYGAGLGDVSRYYQDLEEVVHCKLSTESTTQLMIKTKTILAKDLFQLDALKLDKIVNDLILQSLLMDEKLAPIAAIRAEGMGRDSESKIIKDFVRDEVVPVLTAIRNKHEKYQFTFHKQAWEPQYLAWKVNYTPINSAKSITCRGFIPLSNAVGKNLNDCTNGSTLSTFRNVIGQNLSGLNKQLLGQLNSIQLPPLKYEKIKGRFRTNGEIDTEILELFDKESDAYQLAINPNLELFSPLRNGSIRFEKLSLVDAFGQEKIVLDKKNDINLILAQSFGKNQAKSTENIPLFSSLVQAAQVQFKWKNSSNETVYQDTGKIDHPIMGWIIPNYLDKTILIYNHEGVEIKALRITATGIIEEFYPTKDGELDEEKIKIDREKNTNEIIKEISATIDVEAFLRQAQQLREKLVESQKIRLDVSIVSLLYGKPIVIATAEVSLNVLGKLHQNPKWEAQFTKDTGGVEQHKIVLKIGKNNCNDDGLLGYYLSNDYSHFRQGGEIELKPNGEAQKITVLLTAGTGFYLDAGTYLPLKYVELMPHTITDLMKEIHVSYLLCPFIAQKQKPNIPLVASQDTQWEWLRKNGINTWVNPETIEVRNNEDEVGINHNKIFEGWIKLKTSDTTKN